MPRDSHPLPQWRHVAALAREDDRSVLAEESPSARFATFVARRRERVGVLRVPRAALVLVIEGSKRVVRGGRALCVRPAEVLVVPAGWQAEVVNVPDERSGVYRALFIDFPSELILRAILAHPRLQRTSATPRTSGPIPLPQALVPSLMHLAEGLRQPGLALHVVEHRAMEVLLTLADLGMLPPPRPNSQYPVAAAIRELVRGRPDEAWTIAVVGRELGMSAATLRRRLAAEGVGFRELLLDERMAHAHALLAGNGVTVRAAATAAGYASAARFARRYRRRYGMNPSCRQS